jgi:hypothetical protein
MEEKDCLQFIESITKQFNETNEFICISRHTLAMIDGINVNIYIRREKYNKSYEYSYIIKSRWIMRSTKEYDEDEIEYVRLLEKENFKTLLDLLIDIKIVMSNYRFLDHRLLSPDDLIYAKLQRSFFPLSKENECSICYEHTNEYTMCAHPICFQCRNKCIKKNSSLCPICREDNLNTIPRGLTYNML